MTVCPLCLETFFGGAKVCDKCDIRTYPLCACGSEWQSESDWSRHDINVVVNGEIIVHRQNTRCGPLPMMREAQA